MTDDKSRMVLIADYMLSFSHKQSIEHLNWNKKVPPAEFKVLAMPLFRWIVSHRCVTLRAVKKELDSDWNYVGCESESNKSVLPESESDLNRK